LPGFRSPCTASRREGGRIIKQRIRPAAAAPALVRLCHIRPSPMAPAPPSPPLSTHRC
jgi:hypothetical protein